MSTRSMLWNSWERASALLDLLESAQTAHSMPGIHTFIGAKTTSYADPRALAGDVVESLAGWLEVPNGAQPNMEHFHSYFTGGLITQMRNHARSGMVTPNDLRDLATRMREGDAGNGDTELQLLLDAAQSEQRKFSYLTRARR